MCVCVCGGGGGVVVVGGGVVVVVGRGVVWCKQLADPNIRHCMTTARRRHAR